MHGRFEFGKLAKYPHMKPEDIAVWELFIEKFAKHFDTVDYDFHVGEGAPQAPTLPKNIARDGKMLTQRKIDVVGFYFEEIYIIELKPKADVRALGQVLLYYKLYKAQETITGNVFKMVIARDIERDLIDLYLEHDVILQLV